MWVKNKLHMQKFWGEKIHGLMQKFQQLTKLIMKPFPMYQATVKQEACQSVTHNLSSLIE